jgi:hypothetical protein
MLINQNRIELMPQNGIYDEYQLDPAETGTVLPGAIVCYKNRGDINDRGPNNWWENKTFEAMDAVNSVWATTQAITTTFDADGVAFNVVIEDALQGKGINTPSKVGDLILVRRGVSGDRYLVRCVEGNYEYGDPLYFIQTPNGVYLTKTRGSAQQVRAICKENFNVDASMMDLTDGSPEGYPNRGSGLNGKVVNLLRVEVLA